PPPPRGLGEQLAERRGNAIRPAWGHVEARDLVDDRVEQTADRRADNGRAAAHRLERHHPKRLVPGSADHDVGRAKERRHVATLQTSDEPDPVRDTEPGRELGEATVLRILRQLLLRWAAGDDELRSWNLGQRLDHIPDSLALDKTRDADDPVETWRPRLPPARTPPRPPQHAGCRRSGPGLASAARCRRRARTAPDSRRTARPGCGADRHRGARAR